MLSRHFVSCFSLLVLAPLLWTDPSAGATWGIQSVSESGSDHGHNATSLALDGAGAPRIAYFEGFSRALRYAEKSQGSWFHTLVDSIGGDTGRWVSLALDTQGDPHISYNYFLDNNLDPTGDLKYTTRSGGVWIVETVDSSGTTGEYTSIAVDAQDNPHISYYDNSDGDLMYAFKAGGTWTIQTVESTGNVGAYTSLALDSQGRPHIAYQDVGGLRLRYATKSGAAWSLETVATNVVSVQLSMDLDTQDRPHIGYFDQFVSKTKYATKASGVWTNSIAAALGAEIFGAFIALQVDSQDVPHMTYYDLQTGRCRYAVKNGNGGSFWVRDFVGTTEGIWNSLALDSGDHPHLSFYVPTTDELCYAVFTDNTSDLGADPRATLVTLDAFPNPLNVSTTLLLRSPRSIPLHLVVVDARGRVVRDLADRQLEPGTHTFGWDGRDDVGRPVAAGVYFAVARPDWLATSRKLIVVR